MPSLDHKIPPPLIALACVIAAWLLARAVPGVAFVWPSRVPIAVLCIAAGVLLALSGIVTFRKARTTLDPHAPDRATSMVRTGPYRFTRNPMYLGLATALLGICIYFANPLTLVALIFFIGYITRYQIVPEERALLAKFGEPYARYLRSVRRWI
ncbi:MAG: Putative protein-S-isoprenylcysteine methyltransferase [Burkholderiaceae bacterium]|jgi:protein-S-isoprenylcysteine O-methyltransferase Ste14|nr:MAG: Putative protein-S-isoprenylcysteine methyltransferase [Burkholderiaceae bacterium]